MSYKTESVKAMKRAHSQPVAFLVWGRVGGFFCLPVFVPVPHSSEFCLVGFTMGIRRPRPCCVITTSGQLMGQRPPRVEREGSAQL